MTHLLCLIIQNQLTPAIVIALIWFDRSSILFLSQDIIQIDVISSILEFMASVASVYPALCGIQREAKKTFFYVKIVWGWF